MNNIEELNIALSHICTDTLSLTGEDARYVNKHGNAVPRVTKILSKMIHSDGLMYWANHIGLKGQRYSEVLNEASSIGTLAHNAIENYLTKTFETPDNIPFLGFLLWYNTVTKTIGMPIEVIYVEKMLAGDLFGGTLDTLAKIGDKIFLIDYKTSNNVTFKYFLQLAAYRNLLRSIMNVNIDGVIVLQLNKSEPGFNEYLLDFTIPEHLEFMNQCEYTFMSLVLAYYNIENAEMGFKSIFSTSAKRGISDE